MSRTRGAVLATLIAIVGCNKPADQTKRVGFLDDDTTGAQQGQVRATPKPPFGGSPDSVAREDVIRYAESLQFDTLPLARDTRLMPARNARTVGSVLTSDPEIGSHRLDSAALDSGRVIARFTASADDGVSVLRRGVTYLWMDRRHGSWRMAFIQAAGAIAWRPARVASIGSHTLNPSVRIQAMAMAKWKWNSNGTWVICNSCIRSGWCETDSTLR